MKNIIAILDAIGVYKTPCSLAIGMFDGLHIGHKKVMSALIEVASDTKSTPCVLTFSPHPSTVIPMGRPPVEMLCSPSIRAEMFAGAGAKKVFVKNFDKEFAELTPDEFSRFLREKFPNLKGIVTGENFVFGRKAEGDFKTLEKICSENGWEYRPVKGVLRDDGKRISSSLLRNALKNGDLDAFGKMAGYPYECDGKVEGGRELGRTIGFPTLNLPWNPDCKPPYGVYAVELRADGCARMCRGVANYGLSPTVGTLESPVLETYLFNPTKLGRGDRIRVRLMKFLRGEKTFSGLEDLKRQISADVEAAKEFFSRKKLR